MIQKRIIFDLLHMSLYSDKDLKDELYYTKRKISKDFKYDNCIPQLKSTSIYRKFNKDVL